MQIEPPPNFIVPLPWRLRVMKIGETIRINDREEGSVRTTVSRYASSMRRIGQPDAFTVSKVNGGIEIQRLA